MSADDFLNRITRAPVVSGVLIEQRGRYLVLQHRNPPDAYGLWGWPAGFVEQGDELEATAVREAKEETGLDVRIMRELGVFHTHATDVVKHLYSAEVSAANSASTKQRSWMQDGSVATRWKRWEFKVCCEPTGSSMASNFMKRWGHDLHCL